MGNALILSIQIGFIHGIILSILLSILILITIYVNTEIWVSDYPPDIQEKYGSKSRKTTWQRGIVGLCFLGIILLMINFSLIQFYLRSSEPPNFVGIFFNVFVMLSVFNVTDLLILDWLFFVNIRPQFIILPGTEGMPGYDDYMFHFKGFLIGTIIITLTSTVVAILPTIMDLLF